MHNELLSQLLWLRKHQVHPVLSRIEDMFCMGSSYNASLYETKNGSVECFDTPYNDNNDALEVFTNMTGAVRVACEGWFEQISIVDSLCIFLGVETLSSELQHPLEFNTESFLCSLLVAARLSAGIELEENIGLRAVLDKLAKCFYRFNEIFIVTEYYEEGEDYSKP